MNPTQSKDRYETAKETKIACRNLANERANVLIPLLREWAAQFLGQKVALATGGLTKKAKEALPTYEKEGFRWYLQTSHSSVVLKFDQCLNIPNGFSCVYEKGFYYVAEIPSGVLDRLYTEFEPFKTDYDIAEIRAKLAQIKDLEKQIDQVKQSMGEFSDGLNGH